MAESAPPQLPDLPPEMLTFTLLKASTSIAPRLGRLILPGRATISTPHYISNTSRGAVPHISQDNFRKHTNIHGVYVALEDFIEKLPQQTPPIYTLEPPATESALRSFIALSEETLLVLGPRRVPPVPCPAANTNTALSILTSVGFRQITSEDYAAATQRLQPDIVVGLGDIPFGQQQPGPKRIDKMSDRTEKWTRDIVSGRRGLDKTVKNPKASYEVFAPVLPVGRELQSWYLDHLVDDMLEEISGLVIYDSHILAELPDELQLLPRLSFELPSSPQKLLYQILLGMDIFIVPFIADATDAGIALDFSFPPSASSTTEAASEISINKKSLGIDMWQPSHTTSLAPFSAGCTCYACTKHHRAYVQHLLASKEMLGWVLIQFHNHTVIDAFFASVRESIARGTFEEDKRAFEAFYEPELPEKTGQGPRVRGYQFKSEGPGESKKNPPAYQMLNDHKEGLSEAPTPDSNADAEDLEKIGFAETAGS